MSIRKVYANSLLFVSKPAKSLLEFMKMEQTVGMMYCKGHWAL